MAELGRKAMPVLCIVALALLVAGCGGKSEPSAGGSQSSALAPALVVERFLRAANANDLQTMGRLFGTREGPVVRRDPQVAVERRMFALASIIRHEDYDIAGEGVVPGRMDSAVRLLVRMRIGGRDRMVPFTLVRVDGAGWLVEAIDIEVITQSRG